MSTSETPSIPQSPLLLPAPIQTGTIGSKKVNQCAKWKPLFIALIILGVCCVALVGVGLAGYFGVLSNLKQVAALAMMIGGGAGGISLLLAGIIGLVKSRASKVVAQIDSITVRSTQISEEAPADSQEGPPLDPIPLSPPIVLSNQVQLDILNWLKMEHAGYWNKVTFKGQDEKEYVAWYAPQHQVINIQLEESFKSQSGDRDANKLSIKISDEGNIESVRKDGTPCDPVTALPEERKSWLLAAEVKRREEASQPSQDDFVQQFPSEDLLTFKAALEAVRKLTGKYQTEINDGSTTFCIWYNRRKSLIGIQDKTNYDLRNRSNRLEVEINTQGKITGIWIAGEKVKALTLDGQWLLRMQKCFIKALEISSSYRTEFQHHPHAAAIQIKIVRRGIKEIPEYHLEQLAHVLTKGIRQEKDPKICVSFLKDNLSYNQGIDAGGLSRDYFDDLFEGLTKSQNLRFQKVEQSALLIPRTKKEYQEGEPLPTLEGNELHSHQHMGLAMMYCYNSQTVPGHWDNTYSIGRHFDDALFNAALCLTAKEINTPFENLSFETQLKMCKALAEGLNDAAFKKRIQILSKKVENLTDEELEEAAQFACDAGYLPDELTNNFAPDKEKIKVNKKEVSKAFKEAVFGYVGTQLAPIHAIAHGMKLGCNPGNANTDQKWNNEFNNLNFKEFSNKIQGSINRQEIFERIELQNSIVGSAKVEIEKKMNWLKEWIKDEATDEELRDFVKFVTGSTGLPKDKKIHVTTQFLTGNFPNYLPVPDVHTCGYEMRLSPIPSGDPSGFNDHTKPKFIACLKEAMSDPGAYSNA